MARFPSRSGKGDSLPVKRPQLGKSTSSGHSCKRIHSSQHLDDCSTYHGEDFADGRAGHANMSKKSQSSPSDIEAAQPAHEFQHDSQSEKGSLKKEIGQEPEPDPNLVTWNDPDDPENPKNWSTRGKWMATIVVSSFTFVSPLASTMVAPSLEVMAREFHITAQIESQMILSIFVLAYAIGPLFLGPLSEIYGRVPVLQLSNLFFLIFNLACGFAKTKTQIIVFRFLAGLGGSAPLSIGGGVLGDCWRAEERGRSIAVYSLAPLLGPALGPIISGFVTDYSSWRWNFYATSIFTVGVQICGLAFLRETYAPKLLEQKAKRLRRQTGNEKFRTALAAQQKTFKDVMRTNLVRPFKMIGTQPIVQVLAIYMAYVYGLVYLVHSTFPVLWTERYHESTAICGLNYISIGLGYFLGTQISAPLNDLIYKKLTKRNDDVGRPEFRIPLMQVASIFIPAGFFIYAWTAQYRVHWIGPNIAALIYSSGFIIVFQCTQTYIVDSYTQYAASAMAATSVLRSIAAFAFPLFAPYMYDSLDYGWGNSLLGFIAIGIGLPSPLFLWVYGERLRKKSPYAAGPGSAS